MGLFEFVTVYLWNWFVYYVTIGGLYAAWEVGVWGLFWNDDGGLLINEVLKFFNGNNVQFPVDYEGMLPDSGLV